MQELMKVLAIL